MLRGATSSMATNDVRRHFNGALFELTSSRLRSVATDGMIMCICTQRELNFETDSVVQVIVPRRAVLQLVRGYSSEAGDLTLSIGSNALRVVGSRRSLITNYVDSTLPACSHIVPKPSDVVFRSGRGSLETAITQASTLSDEQQKVCLYMAEDSMKVSASTEVGDRAEVVIQGDFTKDELRVIFKHAKIKSMLSALDCEEIAFHFPDTNGSVRVDSDEQDNMLFVVSPIRA